MGYRNWELRSCSTRFSVSHAVCLDSSSTALASLGTDGDAEEALLRFLQAQDSECVFESASREGWRGWVGGKGRDVSFVARDVAKKRLERQN